MGFRNTLKTYVLLAALGGLLVVIGFAIGGSSGAAIGLVIGLVITGASYWFSDTIAIKAARAVPVSEAEMPEYYRIVRELTQRMDMPMPRLYVTPEMQPNAFATGRSPNHAAVAMGITFVSRIALWTSIFTGGDDEGGDNIFVLLALVILAPLAAGLLQLALTRTREYGADRSGARLLGDGEPLARALGKIEAGVKAVPMNVAPAEASMFIVNPLSGRRVNFANLFMTHPPTEQRIARLRSGEWRR